MADPVCLSFVLKNLKFTKASDLKIFILFMLRMLRSQSEFLKNWRSINLKSIFSNNSIVQKHTKYILDNILS